MSDKKQYNSSESLFKKMYDQTINPSLVNSGKFRRPPWQQDRVLHGIFARTQMISEEKFKIQNMTENEREKYLHEKEEPLYEMIRGLKNAN